MSASHRLLLTGATGSLGRRLLPEILQRRPEALVHALVRPASAARLRQQLPALGPAAARVVPLPGDLIGTWPLGADARRLLSEVTEVFHLAALYDLSADAAACELLNVEGTRRILDLAAACRALERLHYVSTCYVAGAHRGAFGEAQLDVGQRFLNHYDRTKFAAEVLVRGRMDRLPVTIYRPAVIVGDSRTGQLARFDGVYLVLQALSRLPWGSPFPRVGQAPVNLVPVDFVARAMAHLAGLPQSRGRCYHLADPRPLGAVELQRALVRHLGRRVLLVPMPPRAVRRLLGLPAVQRWLGLPPELLPYFDYPVTFDTRQAAADLAGSGIACPPLRDYLGVLVSCWREAADGPRAESAQAVR